MGRSTGEHCCAGGGRRQGGGGGHAKRSAASSACKCPPHASRCAPPAPPAQHTRGGWLAAGRCCCGSESSGGGRAGTAAPPRHPPPFLPPLALRPPCALFSSMAWLARVRAVPGHRPHPLLARCPSRTLDTWPAHPRASVHTMSRAAAARDAEALVAAVEAELAAAAECGGAGGAPWRGVRARRETLTVWGAAGPRCAAHRSRCGRTRT